MDESIRTANADDLAQVSTCVAAAYEGYLARMSSPPAPMLREYAPLVSGGNVHVFGRPVAGLVVLIADADSLHVDVLAVHPDHQGRGLGRELMAHAERDARRRGLGRVSLYTNEAMVENLGFYAALGYREVDRRVQDGYRRVFFGKDLASTGEA